MQRGSATRIWRSGNDDTLIQSINYKNIIIIEGPSRQPEAKKKKIYISLYLINGQPVNLHANFVPENEIIRERLSDEAAHILNHCLKSLSCHFISERKPLADAVAPQ